MVCAIYSCKIKENKELITIRRNRYVFVAKTEKIQSVRGTAAS